MDGSSVETSPGEVWVCGRTLGIIELLSGNGIRSGSK